MFIRFDTINERDGQTHTHRQTQAALDASIVQQKSVLHRKLRYIN